MKKIIFALVALAIALPAVAEEAENYIQVTGTSEIEITPNQFFISITLDENDTKGKVPLETQRRQMVSTLKSLGIDTEKALTIANISNSHYKRTTSLDSAKYQLLLTTPEQLTAVFDKLGTLGISNIVIERVSHTEIERYKSECRKQAIVNAKQIATELAEAINYYKDTYGYPVIATGDYNTSYNDEPLTIVREQADMISHPNNRGGIDYVMYSEGVTGKYFTVVNDSDLSGASDHQPIFADLSLDNGFSFPTTTVPTEATTTEAPTTTSTAAPTTTRPTETKPVATQAPTTATATPVASDPTVADESTAAPTTTATEVIAPVASDTEVQAPPATTSTTKQAVAAPKEDNQPTDNENGDKGDNDDNDDGKSNIGLIIGIAAGIAAVGVLAAVAAILIKKKK